MWVTILLISGLICSIISITCFEWVNQFTDFWIVLVAFVIGMIAAFILIILVVVIGSLFVKKSENETGSKFHIRTVARACEFVLFMSRSKLMIRGMNQLPLDEKFLFIVNHQSMFDSIACAWALRGFPLSIIYKKSLHKIIMVGKYFDACGFISIDRENPREGVKAINKAAEKIQSGTSSVLICPEGTRSNGYELGEFHNGSFKIALKAKCPIVLCSIQNSWQVKKRFPFRSTTIYFDVVEVLKYEDYKDKSTQEISDYAYNVIKNNLDELPKY